MEDNRITHLSHFVKVCSAFVYVHVPSRKLRGFSPGCRICLFPVLQASAILLLLLPFFDCSGGLRPPPVPHKPAGFFKTIHLHLPENAHTKTPHIPPWCCQRLALWESCRAATERAQTFRFSRVSVYTNHIPKLCRERICPFRVPNPRRVPGYTNCVSVYIYFPGLRDAARRPTGTPAGLAARNAGSYVPHITPERKRRTAAHAPLSGHFIMLPFSMAI